MSLINISPRTLGMVVGTRAALAFGVGLLLAERFPESRRRAVALTLISIGAATTVPLLREVFGSRRRLRSAAISSRPDPDTAPM
jgi:hypothetical protein